MSDGRVAFCIATYNEKGGYFIRHENQRGLLYNAVGSSFSFNVYLSFVKCFVCVCVSEYEGLI